MVVSPKPPMILKPLQQPGESKVQPAVPSTTTPKEVFSSNVSTNVNLRGEQLENQLADSKSSPSPRSPTVATKLLTTQSSLGRGESVERPNAANPSQQTPMKVQEKEVPTAKSLISSPLPSRLKQESNQHVKVQQSIWTVSPKSKPTLTYAAKGKAQMDSVLPSSPSKPIFESQIRVDPSTSPNFATRTSNEVDIMMQRKSKIFQPKYPSLIDQKRQQRHVYVPKTSATAE